MLIIYRVIILHTLICTVNISPKMPGLDSYSWIGLLITRLSSAILNLSSKSILPTSAIYNEFIAANHKCLTIQDNVYPILLLMKYIDKIL
jgi:hypothetical protein